MRWWRLAGGLAGAIAAPLAAGDGASFAWFAALGLVLGALGPGSPALTWLGAGALLVTAAWGGGVGALAGALVLGAGLAQAAGVDRRPAGAAGGIAAAVTVADLSWPTWTGGTTLVAGLVLVLVVVPALAGLDRRGRRWVAIGTAAALAVLVLVGGIAALSAFAQRTRIESALDAIEAGLDASTSGETAEAKRLLDSAARDFRAVEDDLDTPWIRIAHSVPVLDDQLDAVTLMVETAADVATIGADAAAVADPDRLRPRNGRVDLEAIADVRASVAHVHEELTAVEGRVASVRSSWLLPALSSALDDMAARTRDAVIDTTSALRALEVVPELLGSSSERRWLLIVQTPAELRGAGGLPGNYGVLRTDGGELELEVFGRITELSVPITDEEIPLVGPAEYVNRYAEVFLVRTYFQNSTASPHFPSVAEAMVERYELVTGVELDGAVTVDPTALAAMLRLVGPLDVDQWPVPITADNAERVLLFEQYAELEAVDVDRAELLDAIARGVFDRLVGGSLPAPATVGETMSPLLAQRHIALWSTDSREQGWFDEIGATGAFTPVRGDALAVVSFNASESKVDWFLHREVRYDVTTDALGVHATVTVRLRNDAPAAGLPAYVIGPSSATGLEPGVNRMILSAFTPLELVRARIDGEPVGGYASTREQGRNAHDVVVAVPPGGTSEVVFELAGELAPGPYRLDLHRQPVVNPDHVTVTVDGEVLFDGPQTTDLVLMAP